MAFKGLKAKYKYLGIDRGNVEELNENCGKNFYVDGTSGSDTAGDGKSWQTAYATIAKAISSCTSLRGDRIYVRHGTYTLTAGLSLSKSGVEIIGVGGKPTITTSATATELLTITVPNNTTNVYGIKIKNFIFNASGTTATAALVKITSNTTFVYDTEFEDCIFDTTATTAGLTSLVSDDGVRTKFKNCKFGSATIPAQIVQLYLQGANTTGSTVFENCIFHHKCSATADCYATFGATTTDAFFKNCVMVNTNSGSFASAVGVVATHGIIYIANCNIDATTAGSGTYTKISPIAQNAAGNALKASCLFGAGDVASLPA